MLRIASPEREQLMEEFRTRYEKGATIREIVAASGRSYGLVHVLLKESGATLRPWGGFHRQESPAVQSS